MDETPLTKVDEFAVGDKYHAWTVSRADYFAQLAEECPHLAADLAKIPDGYGPILRRPAIFDGVTMHEDGGGTLCFRPGEVYIGGIAPWPVQE